MAVRTRIQQAAQRILARIAGPQDIIPQIVRPQDVAQQGRYAQQPAREYTSRYQKWVKVAVSRNAGAIASLPLRVYRRTTKKRGKSAFESRLLDRKTLAMRRACWGAQLGKAIAPDEEVEEIIDYDHPVCVLLREAAPGTSGFELIGDTEMYGSLAGDAFWALMDGPNGYPAEAWQLHPKDVRVIPRREETVVDYYSYGRGTEVERNYAPECIVHFRRPNPRGDPFRGLGDLAACVGDADLSIMFTEFTAALIDNGGTPSAIFSANGATPAQLQELENRINGKMAGVAKAGRIWVVNGTDVDVKILDAGTGKERPFIQSEAMAIKIIAAAFDVPEAMLTMDGAALATEKSVIPHWQRYGVQPRAIRIADRLNESLLPRFREPLNDPTLFVAFDPAVDEDREASTTRAVALFTGKLCSVNEARIEAGLDPLPPEDPRGDEWAQDQAIALAEATKPPPGEGGGFPEKKALVLTEERDGAREGLSAAEVVAIVREYTALPLKTVDSADSTVSTVSANGHHIGGQPPADPGVAPAANGTHPAPDHSKAEPGAVPPDDWVRDLLPDAIKANPWQGHFCKDDKPHPKPEQAAFERDMRAVINSLAQQVYEAQEHGPRHVPEMMDTMRFAQQILDGAAPHVQDLFGSGYDNGAQEGRAHGGQVDPFSLVNDEAVDFLNRYTIKLTSSVRQKYEEQLTGILRDGLTAGQTGPEIATAMRDTMTDQSAYAAERIARTESSRAFMSGREAAWEKSGVVEGKEWLLGGNPCPMCVALAEQHNRAALGESFVPLGGTIETSEGALTVDYAPIDGPPAHPNCTCSMGAIFKPVEAVT